MKRAWLVVMLLTASLLLLGCQPCEDIACPECPPCPEPEWRECPPCPEPEMKGCPCADFRGFPIGANFLQEFILNGFIFKSGTGDFLIWELGGEKGLHLHTGTIEVHLPYPSSMVEVTAGSWAGGEVIIEAYDSANSLVDSTAIPDDNSIHRVTLSGVGITRLVIDYTGDNEGILIEICAYP